MDKRKDSLSTLKICRFCLTQDVSMASIYDKRRKQKNAVNLPLKILSCVSVEVFPSDKMPSYICERCKYFMNLCYDFKQICRQADETILHYIQDNATLKPISWPASLNDVYRESNEIGVMKTVVEGGTTVQVSQDMSDSEDEEEENMYNVKINDGTEEVSKTCVKVVESKQDDKDKKQKGYTSINKLTSHIRSHAGERPYPCKYCDKSFIKSHHYTRHIRVKHRDEDRRRDSIQLEQFRCEQCDESFGNQDDLIYHSAIHATQDLTCPLCQEKFPDVDAVTSHIKSHVNGVEFMCDYCELVFTTKEKLESHTLRVHDEELQNEMSQDTQDESSNQTMEGEIDADNEADEDDDNSINVKEEGDHMVVEIKKASEFMLKNTREKPQENSTEESNSESEYMEPTQTQSLAIVKKVTPVKETPIEASVKQLPTTIVKPAALTKPAQSEQVTVIRKYEEIKRLAAQQTPGSPAEKKEKTGVAQVAKVENANDKSLRLLEKELQDLKRTNSRSEAVKTPVKSLDTPRPRGRPPLHSSTPKTKKGIYRPAEEKKIVMNKTPVVEKRQVERKIITKENKEPKEIKEVKSSNKEEKDKSIVKNGTSDKSGLEEGIRRSTRPSKIKDYAKMIRVNTQADSDSDELDDDDVEYREGDRSTEVHSRVKARRNSVRPLKGSPAPSAPSPNTVAAPPRKRGRPRKEQLPQELPIKVKRVEPEPEEEMPQKPEEKQAKSEEQSAKSEEKSTKLEERPAKSEENLDKPRPSAGVEEKIPAAAQKIERVRLSVSQPSQESKDDEMETNESQEKGVVEPALEKNVNQTKDDSLDKTKDNSKSPLKEAATSDSKIVSPTGQSLKKVPIQSLPPGVKPLPLKLGRNLPSGQLCEMQIGKKVVKVQKIVMTKAEVEAMAKQGLVEMKGGTMVLKHGIKLPTVETTKTLPDDGDKESATKTANKPVPD